MVKKIFSLGVKGQPPKEKNMETYDYREAVKNDVIEYIQEENICFDEYDSKEHLQEYLYDNLSINFSVSSYTCNSWVAEQNLAHNLKLLNEALSCLRADYQEALKNPEFADVTIRLYLLPEAIATALDELNAKNKVGGY